MRGSFSICHLCSVYATKYPGKVWCKLKTVTTPIQIFELLLRVKRIAQAARKQCARRDDEIACGVIATTQSFDRGRVWWMRRSSQRSNENCSSHVKGALRGKSGLVIIQKMGISSAFFRVHACWWLIAKSNEEGPKGWCLLLLSIIRIWQVLKQQQHWKSCCLLICPTARWSLA